MEKVKKHLSNLHLYILAGLILVFFGILFLSTAFKDVSSDYSFENKIILNEDENYDDFKIGQIKFTNNGVISVKEKIQPFIACEGQDDLNLRFIGADQDYYGYYSKPSIEIAPSDTKIIDIFIRNYRTYEYDRENDKEIETTPESFEIYVYKTDSDEYRYNYCLNADPQNAFAKIQVE